VSCAWKASFAGAAWHVKKKFVTIRKVGARFDKRRLGSMSVASRDGVQE
jgi:hypothetical protein